MSAKRLAKVMLASGVGVTVLALLWWARFYGSITRDLDRDLSDAFSCLYSSGGACGFVGSLVQLGGGTPYTPIVFWLGAALLIAGSIVGLSVTGEEATCQVCGAQLSWFHAKVGGATRCSQHVNN
jgi:hypothetical protein